MTWDFKKIIRNRNNNRKPVKAFKGGDCRKFKSISHAALAMGCSTGKIKNHIATGRELKGYVFEWG